MKIAFVWDWKPNYWQSYTWADGLAAALVELQKRGHEVTVYADTDQDIPNPLLFIQPISLLYLALEVRDNPDVILHWADATRPNARPLQKWGIPMALCFAGGEPMGETVHFFNHVFVESQVYKDIFKKNDIPCSIAFGTNTDLFKPVEQPKTIDAIFPATFAAWKRHDLFAKAVSGMNALAVGYMYADHEKECWQICIDNGIPVLPHVSAEVLHRLYAASKSVVITSQSSGGSQRTVLEALAMNIPCIVTDSDKFDYEGVIRVEPTIEAVRDAFYRAIDPHNAHQNTRDYILNNWSHIKYADALEKGLKSIL